MTSHHPTMREVLSGPLLPVPPDASPARGAQQGVVTISREPGARGEEIAHALGRELGLPVYDREIIHRIAEAAHVNERAVVFLDERVHPPLTDWFRAMEPHVYLSPNAYFEQLVQVVKGIASLGAAVILGRGAHLIVGPGGAVRVQVVAPLDQRVRALAERDGVDLQEAARRVARAEAERGAFLTRYFHVNPCDPSDFDLVVNTGVLGVEGAVDVIRHAMVRLRERKCEGALA